jgi:hypothetical protein
MGEALFCAGRGEIEKLVSDFTSQPRRSLQARAVPHPVSRELPLSKWHQRSAAPVPRPACAYADMSLLALGVTRTVAARLMTAAAVSHAPGTARFPVTPINQVTMNGVKPPTAVARL